MPAKLDANSGWQNTLIAIAMHKLKVYTFGFPAIIQLIMKAIFRYYIIGMISLSCFLPGMQAQVSNQMNWPQFRGPSASGILNGADLPVNWDLESGKNIRWKRFIPGLGHSCPVIWENKVFLTTAISGSGENSVKVGLYGNIDDVDDESVHKFKVYCIDRESGKLLWERMAHKGVPKTRRHTKASHANPTPATNGKYVIAFFGSEGMYCYDIEGNLQWKKEFGRMNAGPYTSPEVEWGFASSPVIAENKVIVQCDFIGDSFIAAYDLESGQELWKTMRDEISTWGTPTVFTEGNNRQVLVNGWKHMGGYSLDTGEEIWFMSGGGDAPTPTPLAANDHFYIHNAHGRYSPIYAVKKTAEGNITLGEQETSNEHITWSIKRGGAYQSTNLVIGEYLYNLRGNGLLICFNAFTGEQIYQERLPDSAGITASGVASDGKIYYAFEHGNVFIIKQGPEFEILGKNNMQGLIMASPAIAEDMLLIRTDQYLISIGKE